MIRRLVLFFAPVILLLGATSAHADTFQVTLGGGLYGVLNLTAMPQAGGSFLVKGVIGSETISGSTMSVGTLVPPNASGVIGFPPRGDGFTYDNVIFPGSSTIFDNAGLLFTLAGLNGLIYENLYSIGNSLYLQSAFLNNGAPFPNDFTFVPVTISVVSTPEPSSLVLCLAGMVVFIALMSKQKKILT